MVGGDGEVDVVVASSSEEGRLEAAAATSDGQRQMREDRKAAMKADWKRLDNNRGRATAAAVKEERKSNVANEKSRPCLIKNIKTKAIGKPKERNQDKSTAIRKRGWRHGRSEEPIADLGNARRGTAIASGNPSSDPPQLLPIDEPLAHSRSLSVGSPEVSKKKRGDNKRCRSREIVKWTGWVESGREDKKLNAAHRKRWCTQNSVPRMPARRPMDVGRSTSSHRDRRSFSRQYRGTALFIPGFPISYNSGNIYLSSHCDRGPRSRCLPVT
ncbi:hypothetical protein B296_00052540 [Ensete ventricosum]|uniref:Uncharacterized protein n=1 Tax=Ensete ventricosum TaxID=4639 RepID=A0A426XHS8_ENSVE|nr:hypothetical protein B296_00052540 [Ensete ventricosum]